MAYERSSWRVMSGGQDLITPPEQQGATSSQCVNIAVDTEGNIRSRQGSQVAVTASGKVDYILSKKYQLAGGALCRDGASAGSAGGSTSICAASNWIWVPGSSKKDNGSLFIDWGIKAPKDPPTGKPSDEPGATLTNWSDATVDPSETVTIIGDAPGGAGVQIDLPGNGGYAIMASAQTMDLSHFHVYDIHRLWLFLKRPTDVDGITIQVDVNDGKFQTDYYTVTLTKRQFRRANGWQQIEIRKTELNASDPTPFFNRIGNTVGKDWSTCQAVRVQISVNNNSSTTRIKLSTWDVIGGLVSTNAKGKGAGLIEGDDIQYFYTYVSDDETAESNPSPPTPFIQVKRQAVQLSGFVASTQSNVTKMNVYRTGGTLGAVYLVNSTPLPIADYHDDSGDDILTKSIATQMETDNDLPPTGGTVAAGPFVGRVLIGKGGRIYWSKQNRPSMFRGPDLANGAWADVGDPNDPIQAITLRPSVAVIYKLNSIYIMVGDPDPQGGNSLTDSGAGIGITGSNAVVKANNGDYIASNDGIFQFSQGYATKISQRIDPIFKGRAVTLPSGDVIQPISGKSSIALGYSGDQLYVSYDTTGLVYHIPTGRWFQDSRQFTAFGFDGGVGVLGGRQSGEVWQLNTGNTDAGQAIPVVFEKTMDMQLPDTTKVVEDYTFQGDTQGQDLTIVAYFDSGTGGTQPLGVVNTNGIQRRVLQFNNAFGDRGRNVTIKLTGLLTSPIDVRGMWLNWYELAREAKSFDTSSQDYGSPDLKRLREMFITIESDAPCTLTMQSDHPGALMTTRQVLPIGTGGRRMEHLMFNQDYVGYLFKQVISGENFRVFSIRALIQRIGTLIQGAVNEFWSSDPIDMGTERVKFAREIQIDYASTADGLLTLESDLPGNKLAVRASFVLPLTGASAFTLNEENSLKLRLPNNIKGRLYRIRVTCVGDLRMEVIRLYAKTVGEVSASAWSWQSFPVRQTQDAVWVDVSLPIDEAA